MPAHQHSEWIQKKMPEIFRWGAGHQQHRKIRNMAGLSQKTRDGLDAQLEKLRQELQTDDRKTLHPEDTRGVDNPV